LAVWLNVVLVWFWTVLGCHVVWCAIQGCAVVVVCMLVVGKWGNALRSITCECGVFMGGGDAVAATLHLPDVVIVVNVHVGEVLHSVSG